MGGKKTKTTKKKIVSAAWRLFYEQGYDNTTVDDIVGVLAGELIEESISR